MTFSRPTYEQAIARSLRRAAIKHGRGKATRRRKSIYAAKPREGSRRALLKELESLTAKFVKLRDSHQCQQCLFDGVASEGVIDAGHLYPKGKFPATKFDVDNIFAQCRAHNMLHIRQETYMFTWYLETHDQAELEALHARAVSGKRLTDDDLRELIAERTRQIEELECHYAAMV